MSLSHIKTVDDLKHYLHLAMQLEHATIPTYITALYSIVPGTNTDASHIIRVVAVEEMLHLTLAANLLNAIGGKPDLTVEGFVPTFPTPLPDGETDFSVSLQKFSREAIDTFCKIERPAASGEGQRHRKKTTEDAELCQVPHDETLSFYSIGEFYEEIRNGFVNLYEEMGDALFCGDPARQTTPEYYYSGGGELFAVTDIESAKAAIELISEQGEGLGGRIYDTEGELAHYYRFDQIRQGRYYQKGDKAHEPTGPEFEVDWDAVYPVKTNTRLADLEASEELYEAAVAFNDLYASFLQQLTDAYNGDPSILLKAVPGMFHVRDGVLQLMRNPIPGADGLNAGPTFEIGGVRS
jgi:rubrerythrin